MKLEVNGQGPPSRRSGRDAAALGAAPSVRDDRGEVRLRDGAVLGMHLVARLRSRAGASAARGVHARLQDLGGRGRPVRPSPHSAR